MRLMTTFEAKSPPSSDKLRGGYYTPAPLAEFVSDWVAKSGKRLLEPACGDGNILACLAKHSQQTTGVEIVEEEAAKAALRTGLPVITAEFFQWFTGEQHGQYDGVAGNPPYIRFGNWAEASRESALSFMRSVGMKPNKLTNAWVPFVVASIVACRPGGRVGLVIPAELLQVGYASELRQYLVDNCSTVTVLCFERLVFPGILQEVVLLLAEKGKGPAKIQILEVADAQSLSSFEISTKPIIRAPLHEREKWTKYFLEPDHVELIRSLKADKRMHAIGDFCSVDVGVVTGRNSFFVLTAQESREHEIADLAIPLVSRSAQLKGITYDTKDHLAFEYNDGKCLLLDAREVEIEVHNALRRYVRLGEKDDVHKGYKCRIRKKWWIVPSIWEADAFMLRQIHDHPRIIANCTSATSTDTVHRIRMLQDVDPAKLAAAGINSITFALSEVIGRSYGGGVLELEPSEAEELRLPDPGLISQKLVSQVDSLVRANRIAEALDIVDEKILVGRLGYAPQQVQQARLAWQTLKGRRHRRTRKATPPNQEITSL
jgi:adenine-specific DNA methylase